jgi:hypothetical protein
MHANGEQDILPQASSAEIERPNLPFNRHNMGVRKLAKICDGIGI